MEVLITLPCQAAPRRQFAYPNKATSIWLCIRLDLSDVGVSNMTGRCIGQSHINNGLHLDLFTHDLVTCLFSSQTLTTRISQVDQEFTRKSITVPPAAMTAHKEVRRSPYDQGA